MNTNGKTRLNRKEWLAQAITVLSQDGQARLRIDRLCEQLGVTKGSFYAHFRNRADFVEKILKYWSEEFTKSVNATLDEMKELK